MFRRNILLTDNINQYLSEDALQLVSNTGTVCFNISNYNVSDWRYSLPQKMIRQLIYKLTETPGQIPNILFRSRKDVYNTDQINAVKNNPTNPIEWDMTLRNLFTDATQDKASKQASIRIEFIPRGYSLINMIGNVSTSERAPFERLPNAEQLLSLDPAHKHAMLKVGPQQYVYLTNIWGEDLCNALYMLMLILFQDRFPETKYQLLYGLIGAFFSDRGTEEDVLRKISNILADPEQYNRELKQSLSGIERQLALSERALLLNAIDDAQQKITRHEEELVLWWDTLHKTQRQLECIPPTNEENDALYNYVSKCPDITKAKYTHTTSSLQLYICNTLEYYDRDALIAALLNKGSKWWDNGTGSQVIMVVAMVLLSNRYNIITKSSIKLGLSSKTVEREKSDGSLSVLQKMKGIQHPHIMGLNCFGENKHRIAAGITSGNYIGTIAQTVAACKNFNTTDRPAIGNLLSYINDSASTKTIYDEYTKTAMTVAEFKQKNQDIIKENFNGSEQTIRAMQTSKADLERYAQLFDKEDSNE